MPKWSIEGSTWRGKTDQVADDWEAGREFVIQVEAETCTEALLLATQRLALSEHEDLHTIMSVHMHFGRVRNR